jgi:hypothetical protein
MPLGQADRDVASGASVVLRRAPRTRAGAPGRTAVVDLKKTIVFESVEMELRDVVRDAGSSGGLLAADRLRLSGRAPWARQKSLLCRGFSVERVTGIEPAWPAWKASGTRSRLSVKMAADLPVSVFDLDRWCPWWTAFYRPYVPAKDRLRAFVGCDRFDARGGRGGQILLCRALMGSCAETIFASARVPEIAGQAPDEVVPG